MIAPDDDDQDGYEEPCWYCMGAGEYYDCMDDLCSDDNCIHGDDPVPCMACGGTGRS